MNQERPLLIVTSCTRNYGWVTRAFLEGNTRWADFIVIVDQMSTDATRPLIKEYNEKREDGIHCAEVVVVDDPDMAYKENIRAKMAFMKGRELAAGRDAIYFALDIDEVMPANWMQTADGLNILNSKPGDMFQLEWANIMPDKNNCKRFEWQYKIFHDNGMVWQDTFIQMHTPLLPYSYYDVEPIKVNDFPLLHFGEYHTRWTASKNIYYQFLDIQQNRSESKISIYRMYHDNREQHERKMQPINKIWLFEDINLIGVVDTISKPIFFQYIKDIVDNVGAYKFMGLDVWSNELCQEIGVRDPRTWCWKCVHAYLRASQPYSQSIIIRGIDKMLKLFC